MKKVIITTAICLATASSGFCKPGGWFFDLLDRSTVTVNTGYNQPVYYRQPQVYCQPAPVYYQQAPVYYQQAPVYYQQAPVYYQQLPVIYNRPSYNRHCH